MSDYREKMFGGHTRSYDFGTDVLPYANCNFLWDSALLAGRSFRNYGEFDFPSVVPTGELVRRLPATLPRRKARSRSASRFRWRP